MPLSSQPRRSSGSNCSEPGDAVTGDRTRRTLWTTQDALGSGGAEYPAIVERLPGRSPGSMTISSMPSGFRVTQFSVLMTSEIPGPVTVRKLADLTVMDRTAWVCGTSTWRKAIGGVALQKWGAGLEQRNRKEKRHESDQPERIGGIRPE